MSYERFERPALPPDFDDSRAEDRKRAPRGWQFADAERAAVWRAISQRRDIRRFRPDPITDELLWRLLEAAHQAPSVGFMQPWRFIVVRSEETKAAMQAVASRERLRQAEHFDARARQFLDLKLEGIREAPVSLCMCCDRGELDDEILGRHTIRDTDIYSTCLAIENLWLAARAEGVGVGWVSFYRPQDVRDLLRLPDRVEPVAWLCLGYPDERPTRPGLEAAGWGKRRPLDELVYNERWTSRISTTQERTTAEARVARADRARPSRSVPPPAWWRALASGLTAADHTEAIRVRDASDQLVKPAGSLGGLETLIERWAAATGEPPPVSPRTAILVFAADHGVARQQVSLFPARVSRQVAAAAARGETAIGVLGRALDAELRVIDVGLTGAAEPVLDDRRVAAGSREITTGPALDDEELRRAVKAGYEAASEVAARCDLVVVGEIGIGNTTVAAALLAALTGLSAEEVCGRGTGLDRRGIEHKRAVVARALEVNRPNPSDPVGCLRDVGGFEFAAIVGALLACAGGRRMVLLDGFATGVAALAACRVEPLVRDYLVAGHRSAEPAHEFVLTELGLEPLLDQRLRLGEASGAALAVPLIGLAARLHREMRRFDDAGVEQR